MTLSSSRRQLPLGIYMRRIMLAGSVLTFGPKALMTQSPMEPVVLTAPSGVMTCFPARVIAGDSSAYRVRFGDGDSFERSTIAGFDSIGTPLYLAVVAARPIDGGKLRNIVMGVQFGSTSKGVYRSVDFDSAAVSSTQEVQAADSTGLKYTLDSTEVEKARGFAANIWDRCGKLLSPKGK